MRARAALAAAVLAVVTLTGCIGQELNELGAALRGAPVTVSYRGHPYYVIGPAQAGLTKANCIYAIQLDNGVPDHLADLLCTPNREFKWGEHGFDQD